MVNKVLSENINKYPAISGILHCISYQTLENTCGFTQNGQYPTDTGKTTDKKEFLVWNVAKKEIPYSITYTGIRGKNYFCVPYLAILYMLLISLPQLCLDTFFLLPCSSFPQRHFSNSSTDTSELCPVLPFIGSLLSSAKMLSRDPVFTYKQWLISCIVTRNWGWERKQKRGIFSFPVSLLYVAAQAKQGKKINLFSMLMSLEPHA